MQKLFTLFLVFTSTGVFCQSGIGINANGSPPAPSAILDLSTSNKGFLMPRLTQAQRDSIGAPAFGLLILNTTTNCINLWLGSTWKKICGDCDFNNPVLNNNGPICVGDTLQLTATNVAGGSYQWSGPNGFSSTLQNPIIPNVSSAAVGSYNLIVTANNCSSQPLTTVVSVNNATTPTVTNNGPLCSGQNLVINPSAISGATYSWSGPDGFAANTQNVTLSNITSANAGIYKVVATVNGCASDTGSTTAIIYSGSPAQPGSINGSTTNLSGSTNKVYSIAPVSFATSYAWTVPIGATITSGQGDTSITVNFGCSANGNIAVTASNPCGVSPQSTLGVSTAFITPDTIIGSTVFNLGDTANYSIGPIANAASYTWTTVFGNIISGQGTPSITVVWDTFGVGRISVAENTPCGTGPIKEETVFISTMIFSATGSGYSGSIQTFTVPVTGVYNIQAAGAQGGAGSQPGGYGASMNGFFNLTAGQQLSILVGQAGATNTLGSGGGGGGSFVVLSGTPLVIAGGGGGGGGNGGYNYPSYAGGPGLTTTSAGNSTGGNTATGGTASAGGNAGGEYSGAGGGGGTCCDGTGNSYGGGLGSDGGAGFTGNGGAGQNAAVIAYSFLNGGNGGYQPDYNGPSNTYGGYGGGGNGVSTTTLAGGGGGGGYTGGGGGAGLTANGNGNGGGGGGGGSYNGGTNQNNLQGEQSGDGVVYISW